MARLFVRWPSHTQPHCSPRSACCASNRALSWEARCVTVQGTEQLDTEVMNHLDQRSAVLTVARITLFSCGGTTD